MPTMEFTDGKVRKLRLPRDRSQLDYFESHGGRSLVLTHNSSDRKTWSVMFYLHGKPKRKKIGYFDYADAHYPSLTSKEAREAVRTFDVKAALNKVEAGSFRDVAEKWFERHAKKLRSQSELRRHLDTIILPEWKDRPFAEIRRGDVNNLLDKIEKERGANQADAILATIRSICNWQQSRDENYTSPIVRGMKRNKDKKARERVLDDDEIRNVWNAAGDLGGSFGAIVLLALLTGQRKAKIAQMKWNDVDFETGVWTIATEDREKGNPSTLKLPKVALDILEAHPEIVGHPYVFPARGRRKRHFNSWSQRKKQLDKLLPPMPQWQVHDLRRTARSLLARAGVFDHIAERVLGHKQQGVQAIYNRHQYEKEKEDALKRLAAEIERILKPGAKVVPLRG